MKAGTVDNIETTCIKSNFFADNIEGNEVEKNFSFLW